MSNTVDNFSLNKSRATNRRRSATISVPVTIYTSPEAEDQPNSNVHVSVSVSLSESLASISTWASQIVPGSPPSGPSPRRSSFYSVSPRSTVFSPKTPRRNSVSATILNIWESPSAQPQTPAPKAVSPADLLAHGYTNVFVHLPSLRRGSDCDESIPDSPSPIHKTEGALLPIPRAQPRPRTKSLAGKREDKPNSLTRLRSFSFKGKRSKSSQAMPVFGTPPVPSLPAKTSKRPGSARTNSTKKPKSTPQSRYGAILAPGNGAGALPLAQEVALSQMLDGGSLDINVRRVTERHARATGAQTKSSSARDEVYKGARKDRRPIETRDADAKIGGGVNGIYRDAHGGMWWDEDESLELTGLLPSSEAQPQNHQGQMPLSNSNMHNQEREKRRGLLPRLMTSAKPPPTTSLPAPPSWVPLHSPVATSGRAGGRKGSASDASSPDSDGEDPDLDPTYAVRPRDGSSVFATGYTMSAKERHLRRTPRGIEAFGVSPLDTAVDSAAYTGARQRRERKRPAPLTLPLPTPTPHAPTTSSTVTGKATSHPSTACAQHPPFPALNVLNGPTREEHEGRQEFFASTFAPVAETTVAHPSSPIHTYPSQSPQPNPKISRRGSLSIGFSSFVLSASGKVGRRASVASASPTSPISRAHVSHGYSRPYANAPKGAGSATHIALSKTSSRTVSATGGERGLKTKASRSRLAGFFKRG